MNLGSQFSDIISVFCVGLFLLNPRKYPLLFGVYWQHWFPQLVGTQSCTPRWDKQDPPDALHVFREAKFADLWEDALMIDVIEYLRGNKNLRLPEEWISEIPRSL
jgi:hypothetical protein